MTERKGLAVNGWVALVIDLAILVVGIWLLVGSIDTGEMATTWNAVAALVVGVRSRARITNPLKANRTPPKVAAPRAVRTVRTVVVMTRSEQEALR